MRYRDCPAGNLWSHVIKDEERHGDATFTGRSVYFHDPDRNVLELHDSDKG